MRQITIRILTPLFLIGTAAYWVAGGTGYLPVWMSNVGLRLSVSDLATVRLTIGLLAATAVTLFIFGKRRLLGAKLARTALVLYAFCSVATIASVLATTTIDTGIAPLVAPTLGIAIALVLFFTHERANREPINQPGSQSGFGGIWTVAGLATVWVISIGIAARLPIDVNPRLQNSSRGGETVVLDYVQWQGRTLPDTGLSRLVPMLTALTLEGKCIVVLYSPECGHCRDLFDNYFAVARSGVKVIAIEIPPAPGTIALVGDNLGPIACEGCERLALPTGKTYILKPPTVLVTEMGRIVCATDSDWKACLGEPTPLGNHSAGSP